MLDPGLSQYPDWRDKYPPLSPISEIWIHAGTYVAFLRWLLCSWPTQHNPTWYTPTTSPYTRHPFPPNLKISPWGSLDRARFSILHRRTYQCARIENDPRRKDSCQGPKSGHSGRAFAICGRCKAGVEGTVYAQTRTGVGGQKSVQSLEGVKWTQ